MTKPPPAGAMSVVDRVSPRDQTALTALTMLMNYRPGVAAFWFNAPDAADMDFVMFDLDAAGAREPH